MRAKTKSILIAGAALAAVVLTITVVAAQVRPSDLEVAATMSSEGVSYGDCIVEGSGPPICTGKPEAPSFTTGLMQGEQDGPLGDTYHQTSQWDGYDDQHNEVIVGSGREPDDAQQGAIYVYDTGDGTGKAWTKVYDSPGRHGSLDLVQADGPSLTVQAEDGTTWMFDVFEGTFVAVQSTLAPSSKSG